MDLVEVVESGGEQRRAGSEGQMTGRGQARDLQRQPKACTADVDGVADGLETSTRMEIMWTRSCRM